MTGLEPRTSGVGSDRSTNCATTTSQRNKLSEQEFISTTVDAAALMVWKNWSKTGFRFWPLKMWRPGQLNLTIHSWKWTKKL